MSNYLFNYFPLWKTERIFFSRNLNRCILFLVLKLFSWIDQLNFNYLFCMVRERCSTVFPRWLHYWQRSSERNRKKGVKRYWLKWYPVRLLWLVSRECMPFLLVSGEYPQLLLVCEDFMSILLACREYPQSHWSAENNSNYYWSAKNIHNSWTENFVYCMCTYINANLIG